jgi:hypothetical protein
MGKFISKLVYLPPRLTKPPERKDITLTTAHESKIQVKIINKYNGAFYLIISHGNAENINQVYDWAVNILTQFVYVNVVLYGKNIFIYRVHWLWDK